MKKQRIIEALNETPDSSLGKLIESQQFDYAQKILELEFELRLSQQEAADRLNLSLSDFLEVEFGSTDISVSEYEAYVRKLAHSETMRVRGSASVSDPSEDVTKRYFMATLQHATESILHQEFAVVKVVSHHDLNWQNMVKMGRNVSKPKRSAQNIGWKSFATKQTVKSLGGLQ